jgi:hypothetical protein
MPPGSVTRRGVLYLIVCGAPPARDSGRLVQLAQAEGWVVCVIATPSARSFIDAPALEAATGHPIRSQYKQPDEAWRLTLEALEANASRRTSQGPDLDAR